MAKRKKANGKKAKRARCPECGGPGRGRLAHKATCSKYKGGKSTKRRGTKSLGIEAIQDWDGSHVYDHCVGQIPAASPESST